MSVAPRGASGYVWSTFDLLLLSGLFGLGALGLGGGWWGSSGTLSFSRQVLWLWLLAAGLAISYRGIATFFAAGRDGIRARLVFLECLGEAMHPIPSCERVSGATVGEFVASDKMRRFHLVNCPVVQRKQGVASNSAQGHRQLGRRRCDICLSDYVEEQSQG